MAVFRVGTALAGVAVVIAGPSLGTFPGIGLCAGSIVFVTIVIGRPWVAVGGGFDRVLLIRLWINDHFAKS